MLSGPFKASRVKAASGGLAGLASVMLLFGSCMLPTLGTEASASLRVSIHVDGATSAGGGALPSPGSGSRLLLPTASTILVTLTPEDQTGKTVSKSTKVDSDTVFVTFKNLVVGKYSVEAKALSAAGETLFAAASNLDFGGANSLSLYLLPNSSKRLEKAVERVTGTLGKGAFASWVIPKVAVTDGSFGLWVKDDANLRVYAQYASGETFLDSAVTADSVLQKLKKSAVGAFLTLYNPEGGAFEFVLNPVYLKYDGNESDGGTVPVDANGYIADDKVTLLPPDRLTKGSMVFAGWNTLKDGSGTLYAPGSTFTMGTSNVVLYAKWLSDLSVTFDKNDADASGTMAPQPITINSTANLTANAFTKTGWSFAGWATTPTGEVAYADGASFSIAAANVTLYAKWTINSYAVTFDSQGGSAVADASAAYGAKLTAPTEPTKAGYLFAGWYTDAAGTTAWNFATDAVVSALTLYAKWNSTAVVTLSLNNPLDSSVTFTGGTPTLSRTGGVALSITADGNYAVYEWMIAGQGTAPALALGGAANSITLTASPNTELALFTVTLFYGNGTRPEYSKSFTVQVVE